MLHPQQDGEQAEGRGDGALADGERDERRDEARCEGGERGIAGRRRDGEPDEGEGERSGPASADEAAEEGRDALAAAKAQPDRIEMAEEGARRRGQAGRFVAKQERREKKASVALKRVENERRRGEILRPVRSTLVAPMLPEPMLRRSAVPAPRVSKRPNGIEPRR